MKKIMIAAVLGAAGLTGACAGGPFRDREDLVATPVLCAEQRFDVYFQESQAGLTPEAQDMIRTRGQALSDCDIRGVRVLGLSDAVGGTSASNLTLSQRRAQTVAAALADAGWPTPVFEVEAAGAAGATTATGAQEPLRRRTEIIVDARPRG